MQPFVIINFRECFSSANDVKYSKHVFDAARTTVKTRLTACVVRVLEGENLRKHMLINPSNVYVVEFYGLTIRGRRRSENFARVQRDHRAASSR